MSQPDDVSAREIQRRFDLEYRTALRIKNRLLDALADAEQEALLTDAVAAALLARPAPARPRRRQTRAAARG